MMTLKTKPQDNKYPTVLVLYPYARGLASVCMDSPNSFLFSDIRNMSKRSSKNCTKIVEIYIDRFKPNYVVIRKIDTSYQKGKERIMGTIDNIHDFLNKNNIKSYQYSYKEVKTTMKQFNAYNKHEISKVMASYFINNKIPILKHRGINDSEPYHTGIVDAIALGYVHFLLENK